MKYRPLISRFWVVLAAAVLLSSTLAAGTLFFDKAEYAARRAKFMEKIPDGVAVIMGAQPLTSYHHFYQNNDFLYLCGVEIPNAILVIDGTKKQTLLLFTANERSLRNEGLSTDILKDPPGVTGVDSVLPVEELTNFLGRLAGQTKVIYTPFEPEELMRECSLEKFRFLQRNMILNPWDGR
jgi:Xaa-Pro aminopeptidase